MMDARLDANIVLETAKRLGQTLRDTAFRLFTESRARAALSELGRRGGLVAAKRRKNHSQKPMAVPACFRH